MDLQNASELMEPNFDQFNVLLRTSNSNLGLIATDTSSSHAHQLVSTNSFELNTGTSISENSDSGLAHTNSSISSGDSIRIGLCKFEFEVSHSIGVVVLSVYCFWCCCSRCCGGQKVKVFFFLIKLIGN